jgi:hypothetical protein
LILHIFDLEVDKGALSDALNRKIKPHSVDILGVISGDPYRILHKKGSTVDAFTFSARQQFPLSKLESITTLPRVKVLWEGG